MVNKNPLVSVIIPTKNSARTLEKCLISIKNQTYKNIEIIVVDNNSTDSTKEIAKKYTDKVFNIGPERTAQKNFGIKVAKGKYLLFIDSDMYLEKNVIKECIKICETNDQVGGVCIPVKDIGKSFWVKVINFERELYKGSEVIEAARFLRRNLVEKVGGFDDNIVFFEEFTVPQKIEKLGFNTKKKCTNNIIHDFYDFNFFYYLQRKYYYGKTAWKYLKKYKTDGRRQVSPIERFGLFFKNKKFYSKPLLALGVTTLKILEYISGGVGFLVGIVRK